MINAAFTGEVGTGTEKSGYATNRELARRLARMSSMGCNHTGPTELRGDSCQVWTNLRNRPKGSSHCFEINWR
jgi:hypothetical protein